MSRGAEAIAHHEEEQSHAKGACSETPDRGGRRLRGLTLGRVRDADLRLFCAWAVTFALLAVGLPLVFLGWPLVICGLVGLVYLARRPPAWPALLGAPAGLGTIMLLLGVVILAAGYEVEGLALIVVGGFLTVGALVLFSRAAETTVRGAGREGGDGAPRRGSSAIRRFPLLFALVLFLIPSAYLWIYGNNSDIGSHNLACFDAFPGVDEGAEIRDEPGLWPPGAKCVYRSENGSVTERSRGAPWAEWIGLALGAMFAGACAWAYVALLRSAAPA